MSTRSNIYLRLNQETKGKTIKFNPDLIEDDYVTNFPIPKVKIPKDVNFIGIYHHYDGYISGVGETLQNEYNDYDKILNLLIMGDMSTINDGVLSYRGWRGENTPPSFYTEKELTVEQALKEEYAYLFDNGKWYVSYLNWNEEKGEVEKTEWLPLDNEIQKNN